MAKNEVKVKVIVSDDGTLALTTKSAKKLSKEVNTLGGQVQKSDRYWKGASKQSSNVTKNFSKMQQTIGSGLVPIYATLAAQVFALSAAFRFLEDVGQLRVLREGQVAYASATGIALRSLANDITAATDAQIKFTDASQAAAIGTAAGLNPEQLTKLGKAAKDVSIVLGRDVTDSFNRLVRGVTKAEPELLDELGIVLRLKDATETYAASVGKTASQLSQYERSQAVANDVLAQAEQKYSAILKITGANANSFTKLSKAFDDLVNQLKDFLSVLEPVADIISKNPLAVLLLGFRLLGPLFKPIIESYQEFGAEAIKNADNSVKGLKKVKNQIKDTQQNIRVFSQSQASLTNVMNAQNAALQTNSNKLKVVTTAGKKLQQGLAGQLSVSQIDRLLSDAKKGINDFAGASEKATKKTVKNLKLIRPVIVANSNAFVKAQDLMASKASIVANRVRVSWVTNMAFIKTAAITTFTAISNTMIRLLPWVGALSLAWSFLDKSIQDTIKTALGLEVLSENQQELLSTLKSVNEEYESFLEVQLKILESEKDRNTILPATLNTLQNIGNLSRAVSTDNLARGLQEYKTSLEEINEITGRRNFIAAFFGEAEESGNIFLDILDTTIKSFRELLRNLDDFFDFFGGGTVFGLIDSSIAYLAEKLLPDVGSVAEETRKQIQRLIDTFSTFEDIAGDAGKEYKTFLENALKNKDIEFDSSSFQEELKRLKTSWEELSFGAGEYLRTQQQIKKDVNTLITSILPQSKYDTVLSQLRSQSQFIQDLAKNNSKISKEQQEEFTRTGKQLIFWEELAKTESDRLKRITAINIEYEKNIRNQTRLVKDRLSTQKELLLIQNSITDAKKKESDYLRVLLQDERPLTNEILAELDAQRMKTLELELQALAIKDQLSEAREFGNAIQQGLETGIKGNIYALITGEEKSLKDAILKSLETSLFSAANALSNIATRSIMGPINDFFGGIFETEEEKRLKAQAETIKTAMKDGTNGFADKIIATYEEAAVLMGKIQGETYQEFKRSLDEFRAANIPNKSLGEITVDTAAGFEIAKEKKKEPSDDRFAGPPEGNWWDKTLGILYDITDDVYSIAKRFEKPEQLFSDITKAIKDFNTDFTTVFPAPVQSELKKALDNPNKLLSDFSNLILGKQEEPAKGKVPLSEIDLTSLPQKLPDNFILEIEDKYKDRLDSQRQQLVDEFRYISKGISEIDLNSLPKRVEPQQPIDPYINETEDRYSGEPPWLKTLPREQEEIRKKYPDADKESNQSAIIENSNAVSGNTSVLERLIDKLSNIKFTFIPEAYAGEREIPPAAVEVINEAPDFTYVKDAVDNSTDQVISKLTNIETFLNKAPEIQAPMALPPEPVNPEILRVIDQNTQVNSRVLEVMSKEKSKAEETSPQPIIPEKEVRESPEKVLILEALNNLQITMLKNIEAVTKSYMAIETMNTTIQTFSDRLASMSGPSEISITVPETEKKSTKTGILDELIPSNQQVVDALGKNTQGQKKSTDDYKDISEETFGENGLFDGVAKALSSDFGGVIKTLGSALLSNFLPTGVTGGIVGQLLGAVGFAKGGALKGGIQMYANGSGVINKPTLGVVGEGPMNEAIVPLPDGKSIPVQLNNSPNTTNVTVNMTGGQVDSTTVEGRENAGRQLGRVVSIAVQRELQNQSRPGGLLSPYGAK